ncbi:MAG TPA: transglutaminase-like domain-containing protein, partial [Blastocatellia bacterium]|nr:transglutaminase-like domain-containing protein [Blastocatellia bacterium]
SKPVRGFQEIAFLSEDEIDLAEAALLIAAIEYPNLEPATYLKELDNFAARAGELLTPSAAPLEKIDAINGVLFRELGFCGNRENYYDPRNSFLNEVIDRRTGIPITLSVVYIEVARRASLPLAGVGMPAHFLVKHSDDAFIDPFNAGRVLSPSDSAGLLAQMSGGNIDFQPQYLSAVPKKQILTRMLANLQGIYTRGADYGRALRVLDHSLILNPDSQSHIRDRARLLFALGRRADALRELERCLALPGNDQDSITREINSIRRDQARMN